MLKINNRKCKINVKWKNLLQKKQSYSKDRTEGELSYIRIFGIRE